MHFYNIAFFIYCFVFFQTYQTIGFGIRAQAVRFLRIQCCYFVIFNNSFQEKS